MKVLIADDESTIRNGMADMIRAMDIGLEVTASAADGAEALALAELHHPQLILADINMPHMNGLELMEKLQAVVPYGKVIVVSGYHEFEYARAAMRLRAFDYLLKPVKEAQLKETLLRAKEEYEGRMRELKQMNLQMTEGEDAVAKAVQYVKEHYAQPDLSLALVAEQCYLSQSSLSRGLKQKTGMGFSDYLNSIRLNQARLLLTHCREMTILEVSRQAGFSSQHYFCRVFKQQEGISPSDYRMKGSMG